MGTRTPDFPQAKLCPELQVPQGTEDAPEMQQLRRRGMPVPWVALGLETLQLSAT